MSFHVYFRLLPILTHGLVIRMSVYHPMDDGVVVRTYLAFALSFVGAVESVLPVL